MSQTVDEDQLVAATISGIPRLPSGLVERPRLLERLNTDAGLVVLKGPTGSGKTVLLAQWARAAPGRGVWLSIDPEISAPAPFVGTFLRRLSTAGLITPDRESASIEAIVHGRSPWSALREEIEQIGHPITVIVSNADRADTETLRGLIGSVRALPILQIVASEDRSTVLDQDGLDLVLDRVIITGVDLMFDMDEIGELLGIDQPRAADLVEATGGLAVAVHSLAHIDRAGGTREDLLDAAVGAVEAHFALNLDAGYRGSEAMAALMRASVGDDLTLDLAIDLAGSDAILDALEEASRDGLGEWAGSGPLRVFTFNRLARRLLQRELERRFPSEIEHLTGIVARWSQRNGRPDRALALAVGMGDLAMASELVKNSWYDLFRGHAAEVREALGSISVSRLRPYPLLAMMLAICFNARGLRRARGFQLFGMAISAARSHNSRVTPIDRVLIRASESAALRVTGQLERAASPAAQALEILEEIAPEEKDAYAAQLPLVYGQLGISLYYGGKESKAMEAWTLGVAEADTRGLSTGLTCVSLSAGVHAINGDMPESRRFVDIVRTGPWSTELTTGYGGAFYRLAEAMLALEEFDPARAQAHLDLLAPHRETIEHWIAIERADAMVGLLSGQPAAALTKLDSVEAVRGRLSGPSRARKEFSSTRALLHLALGNTEAAKNVLRRDAAESSQTTVDRARVALVQDRPGDTLRMIRESTTMRGAPVRTRAEASVLELAALLRTVPTDRSRRALDLMAALLLDRGQRLALALVPAGDLVRIRELAENSGHDNLFAGIDVRSVLGDGLRIPSLTDREQIVLRALMHTGSANEIAAELFVSPNTVKSQMKSIYRKLGVDNRDAAIAVAVARHLLTSTD
ncbi:LuxR C-terminal-related transcriptional regulator [Glaciibacter superstes]|uniref:LuxR C-terminal-related transcriptional regulator n=1 Tax=Glaciibacter superstes TaxID=501023 RepID=UPI0003B7145E|nr:LuxR C-terminal-related transcriptional regulator [Glaciibacter superstes]